MAPGTAVGKQHAGFIQCPAAVDVAKNPGLRRFREQRMEMAPEDLRAHVRESNPSANAVGEQALPLEFGQAYLGFHGVPRLAESAGFLDIDQAKGGAGLPQAFTGSD